MATDVRFKTGEVGGVSRPLGSRLQSAEIWNRVEKANFAVVSYVTPTGEPRSSGVVYKTSAGHLYVVSAPDSWKSRHISLAHKVSVVVPLRRGGLLTLLIPVPPATISFHADAAVYGIGEIDLGPIWSEMAQMLPKGREHDGRIIEITPTGEFLVYGLGVSLMKMKDSQPVHMAIGTPSSERTRGQAR